MWVELLTALALVLIVEGMLPFARPDWWRTIVQALLERDDRFLRVAGLSTMLVGLLLLLLLPDPCLYS